MSGGAQVNGFGESVAAPPQQGARFRSITHFDTISKAPPAWYRTEPSISASKRRSLLSRSATASCQLLSRSRSESRLLRCLRRDL